MVSSKIKIDGYSLLRKVLASIDFGPQGIPFGNIPRIVTFRGLTSILKQTEMELESMKFEINHLERLVLEILASEKRSFRFSVPSR